MCRSPRDSRSPAQPQEELLPARLVLRDHRAVPAVDPRQEILQWLPGDPGQMAQVMQWVALAGNEIQFGLQYGRRGVLQVRWTAGTLEQGHALGRIALDALEGRLKDNDWLALGRPTIADIACFPYVETAPEAKLPLDSWPHVVKWLERCKALPGWAPR